MENDKNSNYDQNERTAQQQDNNATERQNAEGRDFQNHDRKAGIGREADHDATHSDVYKDSHLRTSSEEGDERIRTSSEERTRGVEGNDDAGLGSGV